MPPDFVALDKVWAAFGTEDPAIGRSRFAQFVIDGLRKVFTNPLLYGADRLASRRSGLQSVLRWASCSRGSFNQEQLERTAHVAFLEHAYTLAEIATVVRRSPSTVCRWGHRVAARAARARALEETVNEPRAVRSPSKGQILNLARSSASQDTQRRST
jgi:hypothetical protein